MSIIKCENCGAEYSSELSVCPYCGAENFRRSQKEQLDYLKKKKEETEALYELPSKKARKATRNSTWVLIFAAVLVVFVTACMFIISGINNNNRIKKREELLSLLEEAYLKNDYEQIGKILDENEIYQSSFDKYLDLSEVYRDYTVAREGLKDLDNSFIQFLSEDELADLIDSDLERLINALSELEKMKTNGFIKDEEQGYEYLKGLIMEIFIGYGISEDIISDTVSSYSGKGSVDLSGIRNSVIEAVKR